MLAWLTSNLATLVIAAAVLLVVAAVVAGMKRDRKKGKSGCGCGCSGCAMSGACHSQKRP